MPTRTYINDLQPSQWLQGVYAIQNCQLGQTKAGKPYLKCLIADRSGRVPGRMWNTTEELFRSLPTDGFVQIEGQTQAYQGQVQLIIQNIAPIQPTDADLIELLPATENDIDQMFAELTDLLKTVEHPSLAILLRAYLDDADLITAFKRAPAALALHHAYLGGLLEHTLTLMKLGDAFCKLYPKLNRDLIITGLFMHDLGKCAELTWKSGFAYTDQGHLVGHIVQGSLWLQDKANACAKAGHPIPEQLLTVLHHIILSHHGQLAFGAAKVPATPEAIAINLIDNLDAKLNMAQAAVDSARSQSAPTELGGHFTERVWALDTRLYHPDPTQPEPTDP